jgi:hypothetical protein
MQQSSKERRAWIFRSLAGICLTASASLGIASCAEEPSFKLTTESSKNAPTMAEVSPKESTSDTLQRKAGSDSNTTRQSGEADGILQKSSDPDVTTIGDPVSGPVISPIQINTAKLSGALIGPNGGETTIVQQSPPPSGGGIQNNLTRRSVEQTYHLLGPIKAHNLEQRAAQTTLEWRLTQPERMTGSIERTQGIPQKPQTETFLQSELGLLDVLVVVDNSGSMSQEQVELSNRLSDLLSAVSGANWRIGLISTDPQASTTSSTSGPNIQAMITKGDSMAVEFFAETVKGYGIRGTGNEQGIRQAVNGLKSPGTGTSTSTTWLRDKSSVAVLLVSDEDNCSNGQGCGTSSWAKETHLTDYLTQIRTPGQDARVYAIHHIPGTTCATAANVGKQYQAVVEATKGRSGSICDASYAATLRQISDDLKSTLKSQFVLKSEPVAGSVKVFVNDLEIKDFSIAGLTVTFAESTKPGPGARIRVTYESVAQPTYFNSLTIPEGADGSTLTVQVGDKVLNATEFTFQTSSRLLTFAQVPAEGMRVLVRFKTSELMLQFPLPDVKTVDAGSLRITKTDGTLMNGWSLNGELLSFTAMTTPAEGTILTARAHRSAGPQLTYPVDLGGSQFVDVVTDLNPERMIPLGASYVQGQIAFDPASVMPGRAVFVRTRQPIATADIALQPKAIASSIVVLVGSETCEGFVVEGGLVKLNVVKCPIGFSGNVTLRYDVTIP